MVVKIRLARFGKRHAPFYNIVVMNARTARNAKPIEVIGTYDPIPKPPVDGIGKPYKDIQLDVSRAKYWLGVGAQPTDPMWRILAMFGAITPDWKITRLKTQNPEAAKPHLPAKDIRAGITEIPANPKSFKKTVVEDVNKFVERWKEDPSIETPPAWKIGAKEKRA